MHTLGLVCLVAFTIQHVQSVSLQMPSNLTAEIGSDQTLQCSILADTGSYMPTANSIVWLFNNSPIPATMYTTISNSTSQLNLPNISISDAGNYTCQLGSLLPWATTQVFVGDLPDIVNFTCMAHNRGPMWCTWDGVDGYLHTEYTFNHKYQHDREWKPCPDITSKGDNSCYFGKNHFGGNHTMRVTATNGLGTTQKIIYFDPDYQSIPDPPDAVQIITKTSSSIQVTWAPPAEWPFPGIYILSYKLQYSSDFLPGHWSETILSRETAYALHDLRPYTRYTVRVAAYFVNDTYISEWSTVASGYTAEAAPDIGVSLSYTTSSRHNNLRDVVISWQPLSEQAANGVITHYHITVEDVSNPHDMNTTIIDDGATTEFVIRDLQRYQQYKVTVTAINSVGRSPPSSIKILDATGAPSPPILTSVTAIPGRQVVTLTWTPPEQPNGIIESYIVAYRKDDGSQQQWTHIEVNSSVYYYEIGGLHGGIPYELRIQAKNKVGFGDFSESVQIYTLEDIPAGPPTNLEVENIISNPTQLLVTCEPPNKEQRKGKIIGYAIYICQTGEDLSCYEGTSRKEIFTVTDDMHDGAINSPQQFIINDLKVHTWYAVSVSAFTSVGEGPRTNLVLQETTVGAPEDVPRNILIPADSVTDIQLTIKWTPPVQPNTNVTNYRVIATPLNNTNHCPTIDERSSSSELTIGNLCGYETYKVTVSACSDIPIGEQCGQEADPVYASTHIGVPSVPQLVIAESLSSSEVKVSWQPPLRPNGPLQTMDYIVSCVNEDIGESSYSHPVKETHCVVNIDYCDDVDKDGVETVCFVKARNTGRESDATQANKEILVCYNIAVWIYILIPLVILIVTGLVVFLMFRSYKSSKKLGAWERVPQPIIPIRTTDGTNCLIDNTAELMEMYDTLPGESSYQLNAAGGYLPNDGVDGNVSKKDAQTKKSLQDSTEFTDIGNGGEVIVGVVQPGQIVTGNRPGPHTSEGYTQIMEGDCPPTVWTGQCNESTQTSVAGVSSQIGDYNALIEDHAPIVLGETPFYLLDQGSGSSVPDPFVFPFEGVSDKHDGIPCIQEGNIIGNDIFDQDDIFSFPDNNHDSIDESVAIGDFLLQSLNPQEDTSTSTEVLDLTQDLGNTHGLSIAEQSPLFNPDERVILESGTTAANSPTNSTKPGSTGFTRNSYMAFEDIPNETQNGNVSSENPIRIMNTSNPASELEGMIMGTSNPASGQEGMIMGTRNPASGQKGMILSEHDEGVSLDPSMEYICDNTPFGGNIDQKGSMQSTRELDRSDEEQTTDQSDFDLGLPICDCSSLSKKPDDQIKAGTKTPVNSYVTLDSVDTGSPEQDDHSFGTFNSPNPETGSYIDSTVPCENAAVPCLDFIYTPVIKDTSMPYLPNEMNSAANNGQENDVESVNNVAMASTVPVNNVAMASNITVNTVAMASKVPVNNVAMGSNVPVNNVSMASEFPVNNVAMGSNVPVNNVVMGSNVPVNNVAMGSNVPVNNVSMPSDYVAQ